MARVAVVQTDTQRWRVDENLERVVRVLTEAVSRRASLVIFPEMFLTGYAVWGRLETLSLPPNAPALRALATEARRHRINVLIGYPERQPEGIYNAVSLIRADGTVHRPYRKIHLFGEERRHFKAGQSYEMVQVAGLRVGLLICYDVEFPESGRILALSGADLIAVSTANMHPFRADQELYVRTRARENQVFVALANRIGTEGRLEFGGGSGVWAPSGATLACRDREEGIAVATVDRRVIVRARRRLSYLRDRRPGCYGAITSLEWDRHARIREGWR